MPNKTFELSETEAITLLVSMRYIDEKVSPLNENSRALLRRLAEFAKSWNHE